MHKNTDTAVSFLKLAASGRVRDAYRDRVAAGFRHHNPYFAPDASALMTGMEENARENPDKRLEVLRTLEEGDLVAVHARVRLKPEDRDHSLIHIFRFEDGHIAELWDVAQQVPVEAANRLGMF